MKSRLNIKKENRSGGSVLFFVIGKIGLAVFVAIFAGRAVFLLLEHAIKGRNARKTGLKCYLGDGEVRLDQQCLGHLDTPVGQIIVEGKIGVQLKQSGKVVFAEAAFLGDGLQSQIVHIMLIDVIHKLVEALYIFLLFVDFDIGKLVKGI